MGPSTEHSQNDMEMAPLVKIPGGSTQSLLPDDYDDDADDGDAGERPLLPQETQTRRQEKTPMNAATFWRQTSGIVVEVSASFLRSTSPDPRTLDASNAPFHHDG
jgi:hypothetical protein